MLRGMSEPSDVAARAPALPPTARAQDATRRTGLAPSDSENVLVPFRADPALVALLDVIAEHLSLTRSETIRRLLMRGAEAVLARRGKRSQAGLQRRDEGAALPARARSSTAPADVQVVVRALDAARAPRAQGGAAGAPRAQPRRSSSPPLDRDTSTP